MAILSLFLHLYALGTMLGGPFFTSVPSGRVGRTDGSVYFSNEAFVQSVRRAERQDCQVRNDLHHPTGAALKKLLSEDLQHTCINMSHHLTL